MTHRQNVKQQRGKATAKAMRFVTEVADYDLMTVEYRLRQMAREIAAMRANSRIVPITRSKPRGR